MMLVSQYLDVMKDVRFLFYFLFFFRLGSGTDDARHPVLGRHERRAFFIFLFFFRLWSGADDARHPVFGRHERRAFCIFLFSFFCLEARTGTWTS